MSLISERYIKAFLELTKDDDLIKYENDLKLISNIFESNEEFKKMLLNPCISNHEKLSVLEEVLPQKDKLFIDFLSVLLENNRIDMISDMYETYMRINSEKNNELNMKIIVASKIEQDQINEIVEKYKALYKADKVKYSLIEDESIIGGVKIIIGNTIYDGCLKTQLENIF